MAATTLQINKLYQEQCKSISVNLYLIGHLIKTAVVRAVILLCQQEPHQDVFAGIMVDMVLTECNMYNFSKIPIQYVRPSGNWD